MSFSHALKWSFFSEITSKAITPLVFIVLARLLTPEDFGVMAAALMVMGFSQIFWEAGMGKALIQRQSDLNESANVAFWINVAMSLVIAILLFTLAGPIEQTFFHDVRVTAVLHVMTIQILLGALGSVHTALLQKDMKFKSLFWVRFATVGLPGIASIPLAWYGMGYWSLVIGNLVGQLVQVIMLWNISSWRPQWMFQTQIAKELVRFGSWVGASGILIWFYAWADSLIVGMYLGAHDLGLYRTGNQFASMIFAMLFGPVMPVLYSHLSRIGNHPEKMRELALKGIKFITVISIPIAMIVFSLSDPIESVVFGAKWQGIGKVIGVMALTHGFAWLVGMNGEFYRAMGKPSYDTIATSISFVVYLGVYLYSVQFGLTAFLWSRLGLVFVGVLAQLWVLKIIISVPLFPIFKYLLLVVLLSGTTVYSIHAVLQYFTNNPWIHLVCSGLLNMVLFGCIIKYRIKWPQKEQGIVSHE